jgi:hypothetical protein
MRPIRDDEYALLQSMLSASSINSDFGDMKYAIVEEMDDGRMGSIRFKGEAGRARSLGRPVLEAEYIDADGISVSIVLNTDQEGNLFELDFWKADFSRLIRYPRPSDLKVKPASRV